MEENVIDKEIRLRLEALKGELNKLGIKSDIILIDRSFMLSASQKQKSIKLIHALNMEGKAKQNSSTVDLLLSDRALVPKNYAVIMTESDRDEYPWNISQAEKIIIAFFQNDFTLETNGLRKKSYMNFKSKDLIYTGAQEMKNQGSI